MFSESHTYMFSESHTSYQLRITYIYVQRITYIYVQRIIDIISTANHIHICSANRHTTGPLQRHPQYHAH